MRREGDLAERVPRVGSSGVVELTLQGYARDEDGLLELLDAMFAHERFRQPSPSREAEREGQQQFVLSVLYLPLPAGSPADVEDDVDDGEAGS